MLSHECVIPCLGHNVSMRSVVCRSVEDVSCVRWKRANVNPESLVVNETCDKIFSSTHSANERSFHHIQHYALSQAGHLSE